MTWNGNRILVVVPARGGSKGIPRKNLRRLGGATLIAWAARAARELEFADMAVISTDDPEMAEEGVRQGLDAPFLRPGELAHDQADSVGMWRHAWLECERIRGEPFDVSLLLQPTTPFRRSEDLRRTVGAVVEGGHAAAATVSRVPGHFVPEKLLRVEDDVLAPAFPQVGFASRRQDASDYVYRNGAGYAVRRETILDRGAIVEEDCAAVLVEGPIVNIDDEIELEYAEFLLGRLRPGDGP